MRKFSRTAASTAVTGAALVAALGLAVSPASALSSATITGANADGHVNSTATGPTLTDNNTGAKLTCTSATAPGTVSNGTYSATPPFIKVGTINSATWTTCKLNSISFTVAGSGFPWDLGVTGATVSGVTPGALHGVHAQLSGPCVATVAGDATGHYTNSTHTLTVDGGTLTLSGVSGLCLGLINNGDTVTYNANYVITDPTTLAVSAS